MRLLPYLLAALAALTVQTAATAEVRLASLRVPTGFSVSVAADGVSSARQLALAPDGTLIVGSLRAGQVYALRDRDGDGHYEARWIIARRLAMPSGVAMRGSDLWVAAVNEIWRYPNVTAHLADPRRELVTDALPTARHHGWKYIAFGPDGFLYVPVGAPCNVCLREDSDPRFASLLRMNPSSGAATIYASGIRNTVGFDWRPGSGRLWFSDNGRDMLGDDLPPDEINVISKPGQHFGFPFRHGRDIPDPKFGAALGERQPVPPRYEIQAHSAALGIAFYTAQRFPPRYRGALFVAEHGSWNRSHKVGYQVSVAFLDRAGTVVSYEPFLSGFLHGQRAWGRPNDVLVAPDGSLLVSDDEAGAVYRIRYDG